MVKVVHIQKSVMSTGRAPLRLHKAMLKENIDSSILSLDFDVNQSDSVRKTSTGSRIRARMDNFLQSLITRNVKKQYGLYSFPILGTDVSGYELVRNADIIYLHWVQGGYLNLSGYRRLTRIGKPVVIVMHDMWTITGGCHHSFDCEKYTLQCADCPMFLKTGPIDWVSIEFRRKKKLYSGFRNVSFVSPSKWLSDCAERSELTKDKPLYHIPNIIDTTLFKPVGKSFARRILNLDENEIIIGFGAFEISSAYKGWAELVKALEILSSDPAANSISMLVFGAGYKKEIAETIPFKTRFMGFLKDEYSTVLVYNAIDVFVTPSLADNFPTTILECQSCGTPVVGFEVGGIPEIIRHKENGYLAKYRDAGDLASGIKFCISSTIKGRLLPDLEMDFLVKKHLDLISEVVN
ncbi:MAG: glycosyltransferase [Bacteroidota bacterium]|nr:glycosyltransferase [Bacteroidota bacterium]